MTTFVRVHSVTPHTNHHAEIVFTTGETRIIDLTPYIATGVIFAPVRNDPAVFRSMRVEGGTIAWPNGADIDPDVLYYNGPPPWAQQTVTQTAETPE